MNISKLCPHCKRGKESLELDPHSFVCPYINCHNGKNCSRFVKLKSDIKKNIWEKYFFKIYK